MYESTIKIKRTRAKSPAEKDEDIKNLRSNIKNMMCYKVSSASANTHSNAMASKETLRVVWGESEVYKLT